jgi:hypothetical protein
VSPSRRLVLAGWLAFTASGVLYLVSAVRAGDVWSMAGAVVWLVGVAAFLLALRADD